MYKLYKSFLDTEPTAIFCAVDNSYIPIDPANTDYQEYLEWVEKGNTPEAADVPPDPTYKELRAAEYPSIVDQLDKIYHTGIDGWKSDIQVVKDKYPKE